jgi:hypothetical protein
MKYVLIVHLFKLVDVNIFFEMTRNSPASFVIFFFQKTQSNLEKFDLGQNQSELRFGMEGVLQSAMLRSHG